MPIGSNLFQWYGVVLGPIGSPYADHLLPVMLTVSSKYPCVPEGRTGLKVGASDLAVCLHPQWSGEPGILGYEYCQLARSVLAVRRGVSC